MNADLQQRRNEALALFEQADEIYDEAACAAAIARMADKISNDLSDSYPLVLSVMGGAVVFTGQLLPLLRFPLDFDYIHITRYGNKFHGGAFEWLRKPANVAGRDVLVLDDILDEGHTMHAIVEAILSMGARSCRSAVFANKLIDKEKPISADYVGLDVPNRYVFGYGMDAKQMWRNLGAIYAMK